MMPGDNRPDYFFCIKSLHKKNNASNVRALGRYALHFLDSRADDHSSPQQTGPTATRQPRSADACRRAGSADAHLRLIFSHRRSVTRSPRLANALGCCIRGRFRYAFAQQVGAADRRRHPGRERPATRKLQCCEARKCCAQVSGTGGRRSCVHMDYRS